MNISKEYHFSAGHRLFRTNWDEEKNVKVFGKCAYEHGHNYVVEIGVFGRLDQETGMILNYYELDKIVKPLIDALDHVDGGLNKFLPLPTAEKLAEWFAIQVDGLLPSNVRVHHVTVQETPKTKATWLP